MSDESRRELEELAEKLFAAGRAERPGPALERRLQRIEWNGVAREAVSGSRLAISSLRARRPRSVLVACALVAAGAVAWLGGREVLRSAEREVMLSAERVPPDSGRALGVDERRAAPAHVPPPAPLPSSSASASSAPPVVTVPSRRAAAERAKVPPRAKVEAHPPARDERAKHANEPAQPAVAAPPAASASSEPASSASVPPPRKSTLLEELDLLKRARGALRAGEGARALELLEQHERERSGDSLIAEATLVRIEVLAALGRRAAASELARRFVRDNPNHALSDRARSFIDGGKGEP